jgi:hypothetical protein
MTRPESAVAFLAHPHRQKLLGASGSALFDDVPSNNPHLALV